MLPSDYLKSSAIPDNTIFGAQSLQLSLMACNFSCLRLTFALLFQAQGWMRNVLGQHFFGSTFSY